MTLYFVQQRKKGNAVIALPPLTQSRVRFLCGNDAASVDIRSCETQEGDYYMAADASSEVKMVPTLGLTGVTINAMALIAPGAFLWTTYQLQAPSSSALNMWFSVFVATAIALLTAIAYAALAQRYPEAGAGSSYYFAEAAILHKEEHRHFKFARLAKFIVGWASHLYYWVYPGIMVAFMGLVITYIIQTFNPGFGAGWQEVIVCVMFCSYCRWYCIHWGVGCDRR